MLFGLGFMIQKTKPKSEFLFLSSSSGHRVLLFSQMTQMLDILQDYMDYRGEFLGGS